MTYIDETGKEVITDYEISMANNFSEGLASIKKRVSIGKKENERYGFIDKTGKIVIGKF